MRYVAQRGKHDCGVACVAMVAGVTYERARIACNHAGKDGKRGINTKQLQGALRRLGFDTDDHKLRPFSRHFPPQADVICKVPLPFTRDWHWVVRAKNSRFLDPDEPGLDRDPFVSSYLAPGRRR